MNKSIKNEPRSIAVNPLPVAIFASGNGSNFQVLIDKQKQGLLNVRFTLAISNNSTAKALSRAETHDIKTHHCAQSHFATENEYAEFLIDLLEKYGTEFIICCGYMKKLPLQIIHKFPHRIINIHPALLPAFGGKGMYGSHVHQAVLAYGAKITGITIHFVDEQYDHGPIIYQKSIDVLDTDTAETLAQRVLQLEHEHYWQIIEAVVQSKVIVEGRFVRVLS